MADTYGNLPGGLSPTTEFERSIARSAGTDPEENPSLRDKIDEDIGDVKDVAQDAAHKATDKVAEEAERQKSYAADQLGKLAGALERVGRELQSDDAGAIGGYATQLGGSARHFADSVKDKNFSEIAGVAEDFGRRQPLAFLGLAAIAGLAASRFLMSSKTTGQTKASSAAPASNDRREIYNG